MRHQASTPIDAREPLCPLPRGRVPRRRVLAVLAACVIGAWLSLSGGSIAAETEAASYILGTGDKIRVTVFGEPDLSGEFEVGATGSLSLPLIGAVATVDLTPRGLENAIISRLKDGYLKNPKVAVEVIEYRPFYILGDVKSPGSYPYVNGMTVLNAIALAGGYFLSEEDAVRLRLELTRAREQLDLLIGEYRAAIAREARLLAERDRRKSVKFPAELLRRKSDPKVAEIIDGEVRFFKARREALAGGVAVLERQKSQYREGIAALSAQMEADAKQLALVNSEMEDVKKLLDQGFAPKTRYTRLQRVAAKIEGDRLANAALIARAKLDIGEVDLKIINLRNARLKEVVDDLQEVQKRLSSLNDRLQAATEVMRQTEAKAGRASASLLVQKNYSIKIMRNSAEGPQEMEATENTLVFPGDIIKVPGLTGLTGYPKASSEAAGDAVSTQ